MTEEALLELRRKVKRALESELRYTSLSWDGFSPDMSREKLLENMTDASMRAVVNYV